MFRRIIKTPKKANQTGITSTQFLRDTLIIHNYSRNIRLYPPQQNFYLPQGKRNWNILHHLKKSKIKN